MKQLFLIHGGATFREEEEYLQFLRTRPIQLEPKIRWNEAYLDQELGTDFQIIRPRMPLKENARYRDWRIHFERYFNQLDDGIILVGTSLGGIFLARYLSEQRFPKRIQALYLVCPPFGDSLPNEAVVGAFELGEDLSLIAQQCPIVRLFFSRDDDVVPVAHADQYAAALPQGLIEIYDSKNGHFKISEFPEFVAFVRRDGSSANQE